MSGFIRTAALLSALTAVACGATTGGTPTASGPSQTVPTGPVQADSSQPGRIAVGQELDVRMQSQLSSETAKVEQRFETTTVVDLLQGNRVLIPAGSVVRGVVSSVDPAGRLADRSGSMTLSFDQMVVNGREYPLRAMATQVFQSRGIRDEIGTAGAGAGIGGIVGGIIGGVSGALIGAVIGAGGAIAATDGKDITLPAGSIIRIRLDSPVTVAAR